MKTNPDSTNRFRILKGGKISLVVSALLGSVTLSFAAPSGGSVVSGSATISQSGKITNINQSTGKASINWNTFSIASDETVNFNQPNVNSITLNRVIGNEKSIINGALNANGQVWILNSNGVLFGKDASINTSGLLATTKELSDTDFQNSNYSFKGNSTNSIINEGTIKVQNSGYVVLASNEVRNHGTIEAVKGKIHLIGANEYSLNLNGNSLVDLTIDKGVLDALVKNSGTIIADGGEIYLTTNAVNELLRGVVNNTGVIEANSIDGVTGYVELFAHGGTAEIGGTIKAEDGFVETSGKYFDFLGADIKAGEWLIDPVDITIDATLASAIESALGSGDVTIETDTPDYADVDTSAAESGSTGDITVNSDITWANNTRLTLSAVNAINVNATIENTNSTTGGVYFNAANTTTKVIFGVNGKVIVNNVFQLQWINQALNGKYELGSNIDASATSTWNSNAGFVPIGTSLNGFTGNFDGLGHTISDLTINRPTTDSIGLFGVTNNTGSVIQNIGLVGGSVSGQINVGGLVGHNLSGTIQNSYATGSVSGSSVVGGLVGYNFGGIITNSYATGSVSGSSVVGGLVGHNLSGTIQNSYATGSVSGSSVVGGLIGGNDFGTITNSYYDNETNTASMGDSSLGKTKTQIRTLITGAPWSLTRDTTAEGYQIVLLPYLSGITRSTDIDTTTLFESGFGTSVNPYIITNANQLQNIDYSSDRTLLTKYYELGSDIDASIIANFDPIGMQAWQNETTTFRGSFDGKGYTISDLTINRGSSEPYVGLFALAGSGATIQNILFKDVDITGTSAVGTLVGFVYGNPLNINNIGITGTVKGTALVGGLVGYSSYSGTIINDSYFTGSVLGINGTVGGLVGQNEGTIQNSYFTGSITGNQNIGGLVGDNRGGISNSYVSGTITGTNNYVGGLVGINNGTITNAYAAGSVSGASSVGGLIGYLFNGTIDKVYASNNVTGISSIGGVVGNMTISYNDIDHGNINTNAQITNAYIDTTNSVLNEAVLGVGTILDTLNSLEDTDIDITGLSSSQMQQANNFNGFDIIEDSTISSSYKYPVLSSLNGGGSSVWKIYKEPVVTTTSSSNSGLTPQVQTQINNIITSNSNTNSIDTSTQTQINNIITSIINKSVLTNTDLNTLIKSGIDLRSFISQVNLVGGNMAIVPGVALTFLNGGINLPFGTNRELILENNNNQEEEDNRI